jgi:hypothetical protein
MKDRIRIAAALVAAMALSAVAQDAPSSKCKGCGNDKYGTTIEWEGSPTEAAKLAKAEEKLVFILHVSGNFEDPRFT